MTLHEERLLSSSHLGRHKVQKTIQLLFLSFLFSISLSANDINIDTLVANANGKPLFLFFHKPHCGHCQHMIKFTLGDDEIHKEVAEKFVYVDMFTGDEGVVSFKNFRGTRRDFAKFLGYDFYPTSIFVDSKNNVVNATPGAREQDYFINVLNYVSSKQYQTMEFETYIDTLDFNSDS